MIIETMTDVSALPEMIMVAHSTKSSIRIKILALRNPLSIEEIKEKSASIKEKLFSMEVFRNSKVVFFYVSVGSEVQTHDMIKEILDKKKVAVPMPEKANKTLSASELLNFNELEPGSFSILEPKKEFVRIVNPKDLDLVVVPGIAFDKKGNRIGHGRGYFDRFLENISVPKIALAYEMQIVDNIPADKNDVGVDFIVTEKRIIRCEKEDKRGN